MILIKNEFIKKENDFYTTSCDCGKIIISKYRHSLLRILKRGYCQHCNSRAKIIEGLDIYLNKDNKWCSKCYTCKIEQAYTRKCHAKESEINGYRCKKCKAKLTVNNNAVGNEQRLYNKFKISANNRNIDWGITKEEMFNSYTGFCKLTNWELNINYKTCNASLDRIDSNLGYTNNNIQWVHKMVNMSKNAYNQDLFINMCISIAKNNN